MPICDHSSLPLEVLAHLDIKNHVATNLLVSRRNRTDVSFEFSETFFISLQIASHHNVSPLALSSLFASATDLGTRMPNLWVRTQYFDLTFAIIRFRFLRTNQPRKRRLLGYSCAYRILCQLNWKRVLHIFERDPRSALVFPLH